MSLGRYLIQGYASGRRLAELIDKPLGHQLGEALLIPREDFVVLLDVCLFEVSLGVEEEQPVELDLR